MNKKDFGYYADQYEYYLTYKGKRIGGAGVIGKPKQHWRHARANVKDNGEHARREIDSLLIGKGRSDMIRVIGEIDNE